MTVRPTSFEAAFQVLTAYSNVSTAVCCSTATCSLLYGPRNGTSRAASTCVSQGRTFGRLIDVDEVRVLAICVTVGAAREPIPREATLCGRLSASPVICLMCEDLPETPVVTELEEARKGR